MCRILNQFIHSNPSSENDMIKSQICHLHNQPMDKVCGLVQCCRVMCSDCFVSHQAETSHGTSIILNQHSINFFTTFTGFIQYKLLHWADNIRRNGYEDVFVSNRSIQILGPLGQVKNEMRQASAQVLQNYSQLMLGNRQFVVDNQSNEQLLHPDFLKDIFALMMDKWQITARIIITNLKAKLKEMFPTKYYYQYANFKIKDNLLNAIETQRMNLIGKVKNDVFYNGQKNKSQKNKGEINIQRHVRFSEHHEQVKTQRAAYSAEFFQLPWSIKRIESLQQIGEKSPSPSKNICSIQKDLNTFNPSQQLTQVEQKQQKSEKIPSINQDASFDEKMNSVLIQNKELKQQNGKLKSQNQILVEENQKLKMSNQKLTYEARRRPLVYKKGSENTIPSSNKILEMNIIEGQQFGSKLDFSLVNDCISKLAKNLHLSQEQICSRLGILQKN